MALDKVRVIRRRNGATYEKAPLAGQLTLRKLRLKKGALDKFRLPVDVIEGARYGCYFHRDSN